MLLSMHRPPKWLQYNKLQTEARWQIPEFCLQHSNLIQQDPSLSLQSQPKSMLFFHTTFCTSYLSIPEGNQQTFYNCRDYQQGDDYQKKNFQRADDIILERIFFICCKNKKPKPNAKSKRDKNRREFKNPVRKNPP